MPVTGGTAEANGIMKSRQTVSRFRNASQLTRHVTDQASRIVTGVAALETGSFVLSGDPGTDQQLGVDRERG